jgi:hypothetical protein
MKRPSGLFGFGGDFMLSLKNIALALVATAGLTTLAGTAEAQYYPQGYSYQYGYQQPRLTRKQIARIRAREEARRQRAAQRQFLGGQRRQPTYYQEDYPRPSPYVRQQVIVQPPQQYYYPQQQYVPPVRQYYPQQQYVQPQRQYTPQPQYVPQQRIVRPSYGPPGYLPGYAPPAPAGNNNAVSSAGDN